ncbi:hypothetical protein ACFPOE_05050 [Caenimonas terrae]|uniref:Uncharacterized protein n=1 Tax=Caenimonas terrae TaxID=696074 RepID=A0ABW0N8A1_9BURK
MGLGIRGAVIAGASAALLACGGGGDGQQPAQGLRFNTDAAFVNALGGASLTDLAAVDPAGGRYTASLTYSALPDGSFAGAPARRSLQTTTVGRAGEPPAVTTLTVFYETEPARILATVTDAGTTTVFAQATRLPAAGTVGQSGPLAQGTVYAGTALTAPTGTETLSWSIEADGATTALACLTSVSGPANWVSTERDCFRIDGAGNISGGTISIERPGVALHFWR